MLTLHVRIQTGIMLLTAQLKQILSILTSKDYRTQLTNQEKIKTNKYETKDKHRKIFQQFEKPYK
jgi:hypothetical protein